MVNGHIILYYVLSSPNHTHKWQNRYLVTTAAVEADFIRSGSTGRPCVVYTVGTTMNRFLERFLYQIYNNNNNNNNNSNNSNITLYYYYTEQSG